MTPWVNEVQLIPSSAIAQVEKLEFFYPFLFVSCSWPFGADLVAKGREARGIYQQHQYVCCRHGRIEGAELNTGHGIRGAAWK